MEAIMQLGLRSTSLLPDTAVGGALATLALPDISINTRFKDPKIYTFRLTPSGGQDVFRIVQRHVCGHLIPTGKHL